MVMWDASGIFGPLTGLEQLSFIGSQRTTGGTDVDREIRFLIQEGSNYFVSDDLGIPGSKFLLTEAANWNAFTPILGAAGVVGGAVGTKPMGANITGIGFYTVQSSTADDADFRITMNGFSAGAVAPEPSTFGLLVVAVGLLRASRRRRATS